MCRSAIRELAVSEESGLAAAAFFDRRIQIWSWRTGQQLGDFKTIYSFGLNSLVLTFDGAVCIVAGWRRGLAAYSVPDGVLLWRGKREDGRNIQRIGNISLTALGNELYCGVETNTVLMVDVKTGQTIGKVARANAVHASQYGACELVVKKDVYLLRGEVEIKIPAMSFGMHTAAFSPISVCLSEPRAGIRCVSLASGDLLWHHPTKAFSRATFNPSDGQFYCVDCNENTPPDWFLTRLSPKGDECEPVALLDGGWETEFTKSGSHLITANGDVYETTSGKLIRHLDFPRMEYPDK